MYAPFSSKYMFSAATAMFVPLQASTTGTMSIAGTPNTTSTSSFCTSGFRVSTNLTASLGVMFIFQFPAIIFFLAIFLSPDFYLLLYISFRNKLRIWKFDSLNRTISRHTCSPRTKFTLNSRLRLRLALIKCSIYR